MKAQIIQINEQWDLPSPLGSKWSEIKDKRFGQAYRSKDGLVVICSIEIRDGDRWLHVSYSRKTKIPTYRDSCLVKRLFIGRDRYAYAVFPPEEMHVNINSNCLHLWTNLDEPRPLPEFSNTKLGARMI